MPPLRLVLLDALLDSEECLTLIRRGGDEPDELAFVGERHLLDALRELLADGHIRVVSMADELVDGVPLDERSADLVPTDDDGLRRCWFAVTDAGHAAWKAGEDELDAYYDARYGDSSS